MGTTGCYLPTHLATTSALGVRILGRRGNCDSCPWPMASHRHAMSRGSLRDLPAVTSFVHCIGRACTAESSDASRTYSTWPTCRQDLKKRHLPVVSGQSDRARDKEPLRPAVVSAADPPQDEGGLGASPDHTKSTQYLLPPNNRWEYTLHFTPSRLHVRCDRSIARIVLSIADVGLSVSLSHWPLYSDSDRTATWTEFVVMTRPGGTGHAQPAVVIQPHLRLCGVGPNRAFGRCYTGIAKRRVEQPGLSCT